MFEFELKTRKGDDTGLLRMGFSLAWMGDTQHLRILFFFQIT